MKPHFVPGPVRCGETRWRDHFHAHAASGLGISAFCRRENLAPCELQANQREKMAGIYALSGGILADGNLPFTDDLIVGIGNGGRGSWSGHCPSRK